MPICAHRQWRRRAGRAEIYAFTAAHVDPAVRKTRGAASIYSSAS
jgi:hypothetical protein